MNEHAQNLKKRFKFSAVSNLTLETVEWVERLNGVERTELIEAGPEQLGGMCFHAPRAIRQFDKEAELAIGALAGTEDRDELLGVLRHLQIETKYLFGIHRKRTNRSCVMLGMDDAKLIVRLKHQISFEQDLDLERRRLLLGLVAQSRACLVGNLPLELTAELIEFGRQVGTYMGLVPGSRQLARLPELCPHATFLNFAEALQATGLMSDDAEQVFESLIGVSRADHLLVMTGGGRQPTFVAERQSERSWRLAPADVAGVPERNGHINTLGAGDVLAGVATFLLGSPRELTRGDAVFEAVRFAQDAAIAHITGSDWADRQVRARYSEMRPLFEPGPAEAADKAA